MEETATQRMLKAWKKNTPNHPSPLLQAALNGDITSFLASSMVNRLGSEFTVRDVREALNGTPEARLADDLNRCLVEQRGGIILEVLKGKYSAAEIEENGHLRVLQDGSEIFSFNGVDVVQFWAPEYGVDTIQDETTIHAEQKYKRLNR